MLRGEGYRVSWASDLVLRLVVLMLPGIAFMLLYRKLTGPKRRTDWEEFARLVLASMASYGGYEALASCVRALPSTRVSLVMALSNSGHNPEPVNWMGVGFATIVGVGMALLFVWVDSNNYVHRIGRWLHATKRIGNEDIWSYFHDSFVDTWVVVRDHKLGLTYFGDVIAYSDFEVHRELLVKDVEVYSTEDGRHLYHVRHLYVSRAFDDISIEIHQLPSDSEAAEGGDAADG